MIQIVPALPPATNGVGDYALAVAGAMRREFGLGTRFVVGNPAWQGPEEVDGFKVRKVAARSAEGLEQTLLEAARGGEPRVLLQLSGYGFSGRGCPWWLMQGLRRWRAKQKDARLVTMFHELYADAPPWRTTFWVSPVQRMVVKGIARSSDVAVTNIERYRKRLERFDPSKLGSVEALAVPSNVGEPLEPGELVTRAKSMVVFGQPGSRKRSYATQMAALQRACERLGISEVHDVGESFDGIPERVGSVPVSRHGALGARDLSLLLADCVAGFVAYPRAFLAKSGVFAAYCAHRLMPVLPTVDRRPDADGIVGGVHYLSVDGKRGGEATAENAQAIADAAWNWYQGHSLKSHARAFARELRSTTVADDGVPMRTV
jgi:hypothetical protein